MSDMINHPAHYADGRRYEPIDVIHDWKLGFNLGQVVKYVSRAGRKPDNDPVEDLRKAAFYLQDEIRRRTVVPAPELPRLRLERIDRR